MTSMLDALIFPHTRLTTVWAPLTLIFRPAILSPNEDGQSCGCSLPDSPCQVILPPPLGDDLPRFKSLVDDITKKGMAESMSRLLLDARSQVAGRQAEDENSRRLAAEINEVKSASDGVARRQNDLLWDERLFLSLAAFLDEEDAGINEGWRQIDGNYQRMLAGLRGDETPLPQVKAYDPANLRMAARLKAWSRLYFAGQAPPMVVWACLQAAADELFELRTAKGGEAAVKLGEITLPLLPSGNAAQTAWAELTGLSEKLAVLLEKDRPTPEDFQVFGDEWRQKLEQLAGTFIANGHGSLAFYDLAPLSAGAVLGGQGEIASSGRILAVWQPVA
jgi:hypothetical protein